MVDDQKANNPLHTDSELLRRILKRLPHPIFVKDDQRRFIALNEAMCDLVGRPHDQLIGRKDEDFVSRQLAELHIESDRIALEAGQIIENGEFLTDGPGRERIIVTRKVRLESSAGARMVVGCISDITAFRHAEI